MRRGEEEEREKKAASAREYVSSFGSISCSCLHETEKILCVISFVRPLENFWFTIACNLLGLDPVGDPWCFIDLDFGIRAFHRGLNLFYV